jgi:hypothetical protein
MEYAGLLGGLISILGSVCTCVLPLLVLGGVGYYLYRRSQQAQVAKETAQVWPGTMGTVLMSSVQSSRTGNSTSTYPVIVYQYQVNGQTYQSQTIKAGEQYFNVRLSGDAQKTVDRYPIGAQVMVYYNPTSPKDSALER